MSTGQGILGNNMFTYCNNAPISNADNAGHKHRSVVVLLDYHTGGGGRYDYIIYYFHPSSKDNLEEPARQNHLESESVFASAGTFDELVEEFNSISGNIDNVYIYMHGDESCLSFYYAQYYYADDIADGFGEIDIYGDVYLLSCQGGRGELASTLATSSNCTVIASKYKVSFDTGYARCGWKSYLWDVWSYGIYAWYSFSPNGNSEPVSYFRIPMQ